MNYISHIPKEITKDDCDLFVKAVSTKGHEAAGILWMEWWIDYKNDPTNIISDEIREIITNAYIKNSGRLFLWVQKTIKRKEI